MEIINELVRSERPVSAALGYFDGLHRGHQAVIGEAVDYGRKNGLLPTVFTLLQSPRTVLIGEQPKNIITLDEKLSILEKLGIERVYLIDFRSIRNITAEDFVKNVLFDCFNAKHVSCGFNYHFGAGAMGSGEMLDDMCRQYGINVCARPRINMENAPVSSTRIRNCISQGDIPSANMMLGRKYGFSLPVVHGRRLGHQLGTPTLNQEFPQGLVMPEFGVYASCVTVGNQKYLGVTDIGVKPTVGSDRVMIETWMPDYNGNELYGEILRVELLDFIRGEKKFPDVGKLRAEIIDNSLSARKIYERMAEMEE